MLNVLLAAIKVIQLFFASSLTLANGVCLKPLSAISQCISSLMTSTLFFTQMQTLASEILSMERGQSKAKTGKEHLERNDFILEKQKSELRNLDAVRRYKEYQMKVAEQEVQEAESITQALRDEALQKEEQSKMLDKAISDKRSKLNKEKGSQILGAVADWATGKSKF